MTRREIDPARPGESAFEGRRSIYWHDVELPAGSGRFAGLTIHVPEDRRPGLVLESSPSRRLRLSAGDEPLLWARIDAHCGAWVLRRETTASPSIVPPIRAREARAHDCIEDWMRFFARRLAASTRSPLRRGTWQLTELRRHDPHDRYEPVDADGAPLRATGLFDVLGRSRLSYERYGVVPPYAVVSLRSIDRQSARVKAWRKHARDGTLPPLLLWDLGGVEVPVLLDGHDRLAAAFAEHIAPCVVLLCQWQAREVEVRAATREGVEAEYAKAYANEALLSPGARVRLNAQLSRVHSGATYRHSVTVARARPALDALWMREVAAELVGDDSELARGMLGAAP